jgi:hypothetical protein
MAEELFFSFHVKINNLFHVTMLKSIRNNLFVTMIWMKYENLYGVPWIREQRYSPCSLGLSATSQQYFSLRTNQPPATSQQYFLSKQISTSHQQPAERTG